MGTLKLNTTSGGSLSIQAADGASDNTLTLPAVTGGNIVTTADSGTITQGMIGSGVVGKGPAFSAYNDGTQSISGGVATKVVFDHENYDTDNCFDSTTNYRFTPTVTGYYQINVGIYYQGQNNGFILLYKNGSAVNRLAGNQSGFAMLTGSVLVYMNGSTDYLEMYAYDGGGQNIGASSSSLMFFDGHLVRAA